ncbi:MAG: hypothetical protein ACI855_004438 [Myxococcota bacterium]|jgi:hypothetical protein
MSRRFRATVVFTAALSLSACAAKRPMTAQAVLPSCGAFSSHVGGLAAAESADENEAEIRGIEAQKINVGCGADNRFSEFQPTVLCVMASATMDQLHACRQLDASGEFSRYMQHIMDLGMDTGVEAPTCSAFSASLAQLRHLELEDVSALEGDELSAAHADIDATMPAFERACTANNRLSQYANIAQCLDQADSESTLENCAQYPMAHEFEDWLQRLISVAENAE